MSRYRQLLADYLAYRSGLGFRLRKHTQTLPLFVDFLKTHRAARITTEHILQWSRLPSGCHPNWWADRFTMARGFALYCRAMLPQTEVPPTGLIASTKHRPTPHIYTTEEIERLLTAAWKLPQGQGLRPWTYATLYGLLAATGLRAREALRLECSDVNLQTGVLNVRETKFGKSRLVPLHRSTAIALRRYAARRDSNAHSAADQPFFIHESGTRVSYAAAHKTFRHLLHRIGLRPLRQQKGPRLHDLRHTFAVQTLIRWYRENEDVRRLMPVLSTYLGHTSVAWTYWYLSASPELLAQASERLERILGESQ